MVTQRRIKWAEHLACMGERITTYVILVRSLGKGKLARCRR